MDASNPTEVRILIVDDHPIFRAGLKEILKADPRLKLVGEAGDGPAALALLPSAKPDVVVLDLSLPGMDGLELARRLQKGTPSPAVVALTMHREDSMVNAALEQGVRGYLLKESATDELLRAIRAVLAGETFISPVLTGALLRRARRTNRLHEKSPSLDRLTPTELRVLKLIAKNKTSRQIAELLFISPRTVETHRAHIAEKLGLRGPQALLRFALEHQDEL